MADTAALRTDPLGHLAGALAGTGSPSTVRLRPLPFLTHVELRADPGGPAGARLAHVLGHDLPGPGESRGGDPRTVLWCGPGWYLVVDAPDTAAGLEAALADTLGVSGGSVVDVSAGRTALELSGPHARDVLGHGCSLDLHPRVFGPGRCARTALAKSRVVLHRPVPRVPLPREPRPRELRPRTEDVPRYRVHVDTSYADYLVRWLLDAMTEYAVPAEDVTNP